MQISFNQKEKPGRRYLLIFLSLILVTVLFVPALWFLLMKTAVPGAADDLPIKLDAPSQAAALKADGGNKLAA